MKKSIFITGAASGIGRATALFFARKGWFVGLFDLNEHPLEALAREIGEENACFMKTDVTAMESLGAAAAMMANATGGRLDLLFNSAGVLFMGPNETIDIARQKQCVDINLIGVLNAIDACLPLLKKTPSSGIITMSSASAVYGIPELSVYSATKHAVSGLTEALNIELESRDIHVCDIMAPYVKTPMILGAGTRATSVSRLRVTLTPEKVAAVVWRACHGKRVHWRVGWQLKALTLLAWAMPFAKRPLVKALAFSSKTTS